MRDLLHEADGPVQTCPISRAARIPQSEHDLNELWSGATMRSYHHGTLDWPSTRPCRRGSIEGARDDSYRARPSQPDGNSVEVEFLATPSLVRRAGLVAEAIAVFSLPHVSLPQAPVVARHSIIVVRSGRRLHAGLFGCKPKRSARADLRHCPTHPGMSADPAVVRRAEKNLVDVGAHSGYCRVRILNSSFVCSVRASEKWPAQEHNQFCRSLRQIDRAFCIGHRSDGYNRVGRWPAGRW